MGFHLCPMQDEKKQSDIPVDKYEVAIFTNRFSSLQLQASEPPSIEIDTNHATGTCDVVSYSSDHQDQFSQFSLERINLIIQALSYRTKELLNNSEIKYVLPFENKGKCWNLILLRVGKTKQNETKLKNGTNSVKFWSLEL